jgi:hypothetical protein
MNFDEIIKAFIVKKLPRERWTHEAHLIVSAHYCLAFDCIVALKFLRNNIIEYNELSGTLNTDSSGYHETLTRFWIIITKNFINNNSDLGKEELIRSFINSEYASKTLHLEYYSPEIIYSNRARHDWVDPNLKKLKITTDRPINCQKHYDWSDSEFLHNFSTGIFNPKLFTHEAHLRLAWIALNAEPLTFAQNTVSDLILNYVKHWGAQNKFDRKLTRASVQIIASRMSHETSFPTFINKHQDLVINFKTLIDSVM